MKDNVLQFGDTHWRQIRGTAMGTVPAVDYAVLHVGLLERKQLMTKCKDNTLFYGRFIDDGIGVWIDTPKERHNWRGFLADINNWGSLKWTNTGHVDSLVFLDMTITIKPDGQLHYKTYQKPLNLYLYIPPASAHPPGQLRSLVFGRLRSYWLQNTDASDFLDIATQFGRRLLNRGYSLQTMQPLFEECMDKLEGSIVNGPQQATNEETNQKPICFHLPFHPRGIQRHHIRRYCATALAPLSPERWLTAAIS